MARRRVAVEVKAPGGLQDPVELKQAVRHHGEVRHHVVLAEELAQGLHHLGNIGVALVYYLGELFFGLVAPVPAVVKGRYLRVRLVPFRRLEEQVVVPLAVKGRVEVYQVDGLVLYAFPENL